MCEQKQANMKEETKVFVPEGATGKCPFCKKLLNPHGNIKCDCGIWQVCPIQKSQSGGWGTGEIIISSYEMSLKRRAGAKKEKKVPYGKRKTLSLTEKEATNMIRLFFQATISGAPITEVIAHIKNKGREN